MAACVVCCILWLLVAVLVTSGGGTAEETMDTELLTVQVNRQLLEEVWGAGDGRVAGAVHQHLTTHSQEPTWGLLMIPHVYMCVCIRAVVETTLVQSSHW